MTNRIEIQFAWNRFIYRLHTRPKKWIKKMCPHSWRVMYIANLPFFTEHYYEECRICGKKQDYYKNPTGKFEIK